MSFKSNPAMTLLIIGVIVGSYLYIKRKKNSAGRPSTGLFRFGSGSTSATQTNELMLLLLANQLNQIDAKEEYLARKHLGRPPKREYEYENENENEAKLKSKEKAKELIQILED